MNWLQCTNCQRLFTAFDEKLVVSEKIGLFDFPALGGGQTVAIVAGAIELIN